MKLSEILHIAFEIAFKLLYRICTEGKTENHKRKTLFKFKCLNRGVVLYFLILFFEILGKKYKIQSCAKY